MNRSTRGAKALAVLLGASMLAAACGDDEDSGSDTTAAPTETTAGTGTTTGATTGDATTTSEADGTTTTEGDATTTSAEPTDAAGGDVGYAQEQEFDSYNNNTASSNALKNTVVLNEVLPNTHQFSETGELVMDDQFLVSAELTSEDPQVVTYVINPDAVWEDGDPIDCDDFQLFWVANAGKYVAKNPDGSAQTDPDTGEDLQLFSAAGTTGYDIIETMECSADGKTITNNYSAPFADWKGSFTQMLPAHVLERESGVADITAAIEAADEAQLALAATFWNEGWVLNPGEVPAELTPSGGPFKIDSWEAGSSLTLVPNPNYWGEPAKADSIVVRQIPQEGQVQALANQEVNVIEPQPNVDVKAQLEGTSGVVSNSADGFTYEHVDFDFRNTDLQDPEIRKAFALCLPRQQIVDQLIKPLNPEAEIHQNRWSFPFEDRYSDTSGGAYDAVDIAGAQAILEAKGKTGLTLQIGHIIPNQRRSDTVALIKASCDQAGFVIEDAGYETFFDAGGELDTGEGWDIALFAWVGSPLVSGTSSTFTTGGGNNRGVFTNAEVDTLVPQINSELDIDAQTELVNQVDTILWQELATIPLFTHPDIFAYSENMVNAVYNPTQAQGTWNARLWALAS